MSHDSFDLIIGLGKSGISAAAYLCAHKTNVRVMDSREHPPAYDELHRRFPDVPVALGGFRPDWVTQARRLILSPGVSLKEDMVAQAVNQGKEVVGDIELFARVADAPVAAITGSNAKSTVTTMLAKAAADSGRLTLAGGNLSPPALDLLGQKAELYALELSSFQLETTDSLNTEVAAVLNITADHMDRYSGMADYIAAKKRIYRHCGVAVWNRDDEATRPPASVAKQLTFGIHEQADFRLEPVAGHLLAHGKKVLSVNDLQLRGHHNVLNALAVMAMSEALGLPQAGVLDSIAEFSGLPHRCQLVAESKGVAWFNDSKGTNVGATLAALEGVGASIEGCIILIAGGQGKAQDFTPLAATAKKFVRHALLFGEDADQLADGLGHDLVKETVATLADAVERARCLAQPGDAVLLSPACASFDMFASYIDRGEHFMQLVKGGQHA